jgi:D-glycero-D-manno-heptose 1,7-bisphosphate phosphatase
MTNNRHKNARRAVFLDKDGTLIRNIPYNVNTDLIELAPGVGAALRRLHEAGYALVVITNQSGVARGFYTQEEQAGVADHLACLFAEAGAALTGYYFCPHLPEGEVAEFAIACQCRKPEPGLLLRAAREHNLDCTQSWMVGDILHDVQAGRRAGCRTILINNGGEDEWQLTPQRLPHHVVADLTEAARIVTAVANGE